MNEAVTSMEISEAEAIERVKSGDLDAYDTLYHLHKHRIYSLCLRMCGNSSDAEDLTQEAFLQVYRKISTFRGEAKFGSWLYRIAINAALMHSRKQRRNQVSLTFLPKIEKERLPSFRSTEKVSLVVELLALKRALSQLSRARWSVVLLHDFKGFTHREAAEHLGLDVGTSKSQLHKAHRALRRALRYSPTVALPQKKALNVAQAET